MTGRRPLSPTGAPGGASQQRSPKRSVMGLMVGPGSEQAGWGVLVAGEQGTPGDLVSRPGIRQRWAVSSRQTGTAGQTSDVFGLRVHETPGKRTSSAFL